MLVDVSGAKSFVAMIETSHHSASSEWWLDSGTTCHMTSGRAFLTDVTEVKDKIETCKGGETEIMLAVTTYLVLFSVVVGNQYCDEHDRDLTVRKTSHFCPGDGFGAYDNHTGELTFRVDNYGHGSAVNDELVLMDPAGACILTLRRKRRTLHSRWEGFLGERVEGKKSLFSVHRSSICCDDRTDVLVDVYGGDGAGEGLPAEYRVEGSFAARSCRLLRVGEERQVVAEIKRKVTDQVVLGRDVFCLHLRPRVDAAFAMGLVLVLDQICVEEVYVDVGLDPPPF